MGYARIGAKKNEGPTLLPRSGLDGSQSQKVIFTSGGWPCGQPAGHRQAVPPRWQLQK